MSASPVVALLSLALISTAAAQVACGPGTVFDSKTNLCVVEVRKVRRQADSNPRVVSQEGDMVLTVADGQRVGITTGEDTQYIDTANSTAEAVVAALKLGYEWNREIDQIKDMQKLKEDLEEKIIEASKDQSDAVDELEDDLDKAVSNLNQSVSKSLSDALDAFSKTGDTLKAEVAQGNADNKKVVDDLKKVVDGYSEFLPAAKCANGVKDGDETDVDCGGSCGASCAAGKVCKMTSDCHKSICNRGKCGTCKSGDGVVPMSRGVNAFCKGGYLQPASSYNYVKFTTCGKTGEEPPKEADCKYYHSQIATRHTLQYNVTYESGFQRYVAPVDGTYTWTLYGAQGGDDLTCCRSYRRDYSRYGKGGYGGMVQGTHSVKAGTIFYIRVGQRGYDCFETDDGMTNPSNPKFQHCLYNPAGGGYTQWDNGKQWYEDDAFHVGFGACGGFNGGGPAICNHDAGGASGGGATDIRMCANGGDCDSLPGLTSRFLVAAGGGGASCEGNDNHGCGGYARFGGHGGTTTGEHGYNNGANGYGGTQSAGGKSRNGNNRDHGNSFGVLGMGGTGGQNDGGGGGGGYYGGGGAHHNSGGGGGSNWNRGTKQSGSLSSVKSTRGARRGEGYVLLRIKTA